jgi:hypothetical protein
MRLGPVSCLAIGAATILVPTVTPNMAQIQCADIPACDRTPPSRYMTCDEWMQVEQLLSRDPAIPPLCADITPVCAGEILGWCGPGQTTVLRRTGVGAQPTPPSLAGCVRPTSAGRLLLVVMPCRTALA